MVLKRSCKRLHQPCQRRMMPVTECNRQRELAVVRDIDLAHYGEIARQTMSGQEELIGRDVILIHSLLKNNVEAKLGRHAYVLYTDAFAQRSGMKPQAQGLIEQGREVLRPSSIYVRATKSADTVTNVRVGGYVAPVIAGKVTL